MLSAKVIESLPDLATPVLTVYLNTTLPEPAAATSAPPKPPHMLRLRSYVESIARTVPPEDQKAFQTQVKRVETYLAGHSMPCRGIAIFAGPSAWEVVPLQTDTLDEVGWGMPLLAQLFWLLDEHRPYGLVVASRKGAKLFLARFGQIDEVESAELRLPDSRRKEMGPVSRPGVRMSRGVNRDVYERHLDAELQHFYQDIARLIERWRAAERLDSIFVVALSHMARGIQNQLPQSVRQNVVLVEEDLGFMSQAQLQERVAPLVARHDRERKHQLIEELLENHTGVVKGIDEVLAQLQRGRVRRVIAASGLSGDARQCVRCALVDRTSDPSCRACNGERKTIGLRAILPALIRRHGVSMEIVSGEAARKLQEAGGICAWLREFEAREYSSTASTA